MVVRTRWFYHPEETRGGKKLAEVKVCIFYLDFLAYFYKFSADINDRKYGFARLFSVFHPIMLSRCYCSFCRVPCTSRPM